MFIIENDPLRKGEIQKALEHQTTWNLSFFERPEDCLEMAARTNPMAIYLDIDHFTSSGIVDKKALDLIDALKKTSPDTEILVFCDSDKEHAASQILDHGALDYIVLNQHQYARLESELTWLESVLDQREEDRKMKLFLIALSIGMFLMCLLLIYLGYKGYIKEGSSPDLLIGD